MVIVVIYKRMKKYLIRLAPQGGDTIIEVVLALTVLSLVLGTSALLASKNTKTLQTSQEDAVALRVAQKQLEYLKSFVATDPDSLADTTAVFCMQDEKTTILDLDNSACNYT